jgi:hypothetical protein
MRGTKLFFLHFVHNIPSISHRQALEKQYEQYGLRKTTLKMSPLISHLQVANAKQCFSEHGWKDTGTGTGTA